MVRNRPEWLTLPVPDAQALERMKVLLDQGRLHTVCESADCPNMGQCFQEKTCTFMILGNVCTRNCRFCAVNHGSPAPVDRDEAAAVAATAKHLALNHVVITSVTRDDLADGGAGHFAAVIQALKTTLPQTTIEVLIPDFQGSKEALHRVVTAQPQVINHNVETVPRLYQKVRPQAKYQQSLELIGRVSQGDKNIVVKSGLMLGLGEKMTEVLQVMEDLKAAGCQMLTLGQYLRPSPEHLAVEKYIHPHIFARLRQQGLTMGFADVSAGPLVRSSYQAGIHFTDVVSGDTVG